jgi:hypothetical protein
MLPGIRAEPARFYEQNPPSRATMSMACFRTGPSTPADRND